MEEIKKSTVVVSYEIDDIHLIECFERLNPVLKGKVAVKISSGEPGGHNFLSPKLIEGFIDHVGGTIVECNTAYEGPRHTTESHEQVLKDHGFTTIAPCEILDATGEIEYPVKNHNHLNKISIGRGLEKYDTLIVLSHFKGHQMAGFGGAMKNMSMGLSSPKGKVWIHTGGTSSNPKEIEYETYHRVFIESMADACSGIIENFGAENIYYINVANNISVDCDCDAHPADPVIDHIGIFASRDPVAVDQCCIDYIYASREYGKYELIKRIDSRNGLLLLKTAQDLGIGSRIYEMIDWMGNPGGTRPDIFFEDWEEMEDVALEWFDLDNIITFGDAYFEDAQIADTKVLQDLLYGRIDKALKDSNKDRKYRRYVNEYIERNMEKLITSGPVYLVPFGDNDQQLYFDLFESTKKEIVTAVTQVTKATGVNSNFIYLRQNPVLFLLYFVIRFYTLKKDEKGINTSLSLYCLAVYWSIFTKYFPNGVNEGVMEYTIDNLTGKFLIKTSKHIFGALVESCRRSHDFHRARFAVGTDRDAVAFIQRIRNDQNSMIKKIASEYMKNYRAGNTKSTRNDQYDTDTPIVDDMENATSVIGQLVEKISPNLVSAGIELSFAEAAARIVNVSVSDLRRFLLVILTAKNLPVMSTFIESILFLFLYTYNHKRTEIKSQFFFIWSGSLFKKTNSNDKNIAVINNTLNLWAEESGVNAKVKGVNTKTNYKKSMFFYFVLCIQKYS